MMNQEDINRSKFTISDRVNNLSQYVQLNLLAFQYLLNKNYKTAMSTFEKCIDIAKDLDDVKHVESLTNHGICQFFCGNFLESYTFLERAREISNRLVENSYNDKSIQ
jgi:tetratricopeptide (TPR) repeat protein